MSECLYSLEVKQVILTKDTHLKLLHSNTDPWLRSIKQSKSKAFYLVEALSKLSCAICISIERAQQLKLYLFNLTSSVLNAYLLVFRPLAEWPNFGYKFV